jgi:5'-phosphate synthase pdxT subunit
MKTIGVMCYQGAWRLHIEALKQLGFKVLKIYSNTNFDQVDGIILPGGESSVQYDYCIRTGLDKKVIGYSKSNKPILGTCAGAILLSKYISARVKGFGLIDAGMIRNFYGRQIKSTTVLTDNKNQAVFIRAPGIIEIGSKVMVIDTYSKIALQFEGVTSSKPRKNYKQQPIFIRQNNIFCTTFHPELGSLDQSNIIFKIFNELIPI